MDCQFILNRAVSLQRIAQSAKQAALALLGVTWRCSSFMVIHLPSDHLILPVITQEAHRIPCTLNMRTGSQMQMKYSWITHTAYTWRHLLWIYMRTHYVCTKARMYNNFKVLYSLLFLSCAQDKCWMLFHFDYSIDLRCWNTVGSHTFQAPMFFTLYQTDTCFKSTRGAALLCFCLA